LERIKAIRRIVKDVAISTDIIVGFCGETDEQHQDTVSLMKEVGYEFAYMFEYSERPKTLAERKYEDDVPKEVKNKRITEIINLQQEMSLAANKRQIGQVQEVLIEGNSKRSDEEFAGRNTFNNKVVFPKAEGLKAGDYVNVEILDCTSATLMGRMVG
jgi:tRNA-2-methylthio-N6-dimethylallyladenosine synthase